MDGARLWESGPYYARPYAEIAALFDTADQKEGMAAFREKRAPSFTHR